MNKGYENEYITVHVIQNGYDLTIAGRSKSNKPIVLTAAAPIDRSASYSGSGLPFFSYDMAFENTPNVLKIEPLQEFRTVFKYPNSFYDISGFTKVPPTLFINVVNSDKHTLGRIELPDPLPLKTLTYRYDSRSNPEFYERRMEMGVHDQYSLLVNRANAKINFPTA